MGSVGQNFGMGGVGDVGQKNGMGFAYLKNCDYLFYLAYKTRKQTIKEQRVKRQKKKSYSTAKNNLSRIYSFMTSAKNAKCLNFGPPLTHPPLPLYPQTSNFTLSTRHSWTSSIGIQNSPKGNFEMLLENFNNEINIVA